MHRLQNAHYFPLSSQGNIYTLTTLRLANDVSKLLVASLRREVIYFEYQENSSGVLIPSAKEISFTYLPSGAEIISMDAFNKSEKNNDFVIGITIIKNSTDLHAFETYLNIYSGWEDSVEFNMESISQNCLNNIELKFIPYHLTHGYLILWNESQLNSKEVVFLLSGSDNKVHVYQEDKVNHMYKEIDCNEYFPEFLKPPSVVVWIHVYYYNDDMERLTAFGCECGYMRLCRVCVKTCKIIFNFSTRFDNTISSVHLQPSKRDLKPPNFVKEEYKVQIANPKDPIINLVVTNTILPAVFFGDVLHYGLKKYGTLPRYELTSILSCAEIGDIDFDGHDEILVGTSSQEIITYKFENTQGWVIEEVKKLATPILGLKYVDITGDGIKELVVLTMKGVHILQHNPIYVQRALENKLKYLGIPSVDVLSLE